MSDTLYLSLWYPNLRLESLPDKLTAVLGAFAAHGGDEKVYAATVWPVNWSEAPVFQRVYGRMGAAPGSAPGVEPQLAVTEATELLHDDYAYEFQVGWNLWEWEEGKAVPPSSLASPNSARGGLSLLPPVAAAGLDRDDSSSLSVPQDANVLGRWARGPRLVRVTGYGPAL